MFKGIVNWLKNICRKSDEVTAQSIIVVKPKPAVVPVKRSSTTKVYLNDPTTPALVVEEVEPKDTTLPLHSVGEAGAGFALGSIQQQALAAKLMVNDSLVFMASKSPKVISRWAGTQSLVIMTRAGRDLNAYYDRTSLRFFYFGDPVIRKNVFACDARSVVSHEFGHAFLDILRPDWWSTQAIEIWAFHEAFGDITAMLSALHYDQLIDNAIIETHGDLMKSNIITRLAAEMGVGLYHLTQGKEGELPTCLRDMSIVYNYVQPETLPAEGRDDHLLSEPHSFSRVFSGAFWELLVKIGVAHINQGFVLRDGMKKARDILARYLLSAVVAVPNTVRIFDAVAQQMLHVDRVEGGKYQDILREVFSRRNILKQKVTMLSEVSIDTFLKDMTEPHEVQIHGKEKVVRTLSTKTMKLTDKFGPLSAQDDNPLFGLEIDVPNESAYYFDENDQLQNVIEAHEDEVVDSAYNCLRMLNQNGLVGKHSTALFENQYGKLVRKQIVCKCNKPNYCDPNAPEYQKPWKPKNNSGCVACHNAKCQPRSCECEEPKASPAPKLGCYTTVKAGGRTTYKFGSSASRKVC